MNPFNKLADLAVIAAEASIEMMKLQSKFYVFSGKLATELVTELMKSKFPETVKELKAPVTEAAAGMMVSKIESDKSWKKLGRAIKKSLGPVKSRRKTKKGNLKAV